MLTGGESKVTEEWDVTAPGMGRGTRRQLNDNVKMQPSQVYYLAALQQKLVDN